ncbi:MAG: glucosylceramidase [Bacteroidetes bacterium]|nr:glucosylceramidase [Bacteroidota bacterium]
MRSVTRLILTGALIGAAIHPIQAQKDKPIGVWLTDAQHNIFFQQQTGELRFEKGNAAPGESVIRIDDAKGLQQIDGFGFCLTGGSAQHIIHMSPAARKALLRDLFRTDSTHIGTSYLRVSIGASDLNDHVFSYDDLPEGKTDTTLEHFSLGPDLQDVVPVLREIIEINPEIKILGSPWSAPTWMKNNHDTRGGSLLPEYYRAYASYFVRYVLAMQEQGIRIDAVTVQNEPLHPGNNPSMFMPAIQQAEFIRKALGPAFREARLDTKIIIYDHNADKPNYPDSVLNDSEAGQYVDGSAFHLYAGKIDTLTSLHEKHPDKNLYFTEQWVGAPGNPTRDIAEHIRKLIVGATRNWCKNVIEWNLAANSKWEPHTDRGGCNRCLGAVTIDGDTVKRNPAYYVIAHAAKFVRPGSVRINTNSDDSLPNVAFRTIADQNVLIVLNNTGSAKPFTVEYKGKRFQQTLEAKAVATYIMELK